MRRTLQGLWALAILAGTLAFPTPGLAQEDPNAPVTEEEGGGGDPLYGYVGTAFLAAGAIFVLCKSARR